MKSKSVTYAIAAVIVVVAVVAYSKSRFSTDKPVVADTDTTTTQTPAQNTNTNTPASPTKTTTPGSTSPTKVLSGSTGVKVFTGNAIMLPTYYGQQIASTTLKIHVSAPSSNTIVKSPITVTGEARGTWYFEASFPIILTDASGRTLASGVAQAKSNWMTNDFVPFSSTFAFPAQKSGTHGFLILKKDNPSGLAKNDEAVEMEVTF